MEQDFVDFIGDLVAARDTLKISLLEIFVEEFIDQYPEAQILLCDINPEDCVAYVTARVPCENGHETLYHYGDAAGAWNLTVKNIGYLPPEIRNWFIHTMH